MCGRLCGCVQALLWCVWGGMSDGWCCVGCRPYSERGTQNRGVSSS